jgi:hypothetical protein
MLLFSIKFDIFESLFEVFNILSKLRRCLCSVSSDKLLDVDEEYLSGNKKELTDMKNNIHINSDINNII